MEDPAFQGAHGAATSVGQRFPGGGEIVVRDRRASDWYDLTDAVGFQLGLCACSPWTEKPPIATPASSDNAMVYRGLMTSSRQDLPMTGRQRRSGKETVPEIKRGKSGSKRTSDPEGEVRALSLLALFAGGQGKAAGGLSQPLPRDRCSAGRARPVLRSVLGGGSLRLRLLGLGVRAGLPMRELRAYTAQKERMLARPAVRRVLERGTSAAEARLRRRRPRPARPAPVARSPSAGCMDTRRAA